MCWKIAAGKGHKLHKAQGSDRKVWQTVPGCDQYDKYNRCGQGSDQSHRFGQDYDHSDEFVFHYWVDPKLQIVHIPDDS